MAATVSAWSKPGAWALDSEEHEQELLQEHNDAPAAKAATDAAAFSDFPSLAAAASTKAKKKKPQSLSLGEFSNYSSAAKPATKTYQASKGLTTFTNEDMMNLPTGPRERTAEELDRSRLGGGFRSYGDRNNGGGDSSNSRWGNNSSRGSDENRRGFNRDPLAPSRADEIDDWGAAKKSTFGTGGGFERRERGERGERGSFFSDSHSRADDSDSWVSNKSFNPSEGRRYESHRERRGGFESNGSGGADSDNWGKKKEEEGRRFGGGSGGAFDSLRERRGGNELNGGGDSDTWAKRREEGSGSGGRPKLNLQPRKLPVGENETEVTVKPKGSNPFGDARPREQVLKEKGQDWKEIDEKLESMKMKDAVAVDGSSSFGKRSFGSGNGRIGVPEDERSWKKNGSVDVTVVTPPSAEPSENGITEESEDIEPQI